MKKLLCIAALAALVLTGCAKDLQVKTTEKLTIEYGDKLDNDKLYDAKESDENVKVDKVFGYDAKKVGDQTLKVTFTDGDKTIQKDVKITVKDTKKPEIVLKKDKITITAGDKLNLKDNVKSVKDPVDGDLKYSDKEIKKSGYTIDKGKLNVKKTGAYKVTVKAYDANENTTDKTFDVVVKKKAEKKTTTEQSSEAIASQNNNTGQQTQSASPSSPAQSNQNSGSSGQSGTASGGSSSGNSGTSKPAEIQKPQSCTIPSTEYGYGGIIFKTEAEAKAFGEKMESDPANKIMGFFYGPMYDTCNNIVGYAVDFEY